MVTLIILRTHVEKLGLYRNKNLSSNQSDILTYIAAYVHSYFCVNI